VPPEEFLRPTIFSTPFALPGVIPLLFRPVGCSCLDLSGPSLFVAKKETMSQHLEERKACRGSLLTLIKTGVCRLIQHPTPYLFLRKMYRLR